MHNDVSEHQLHLLRCEESTRAGMSTVTKHEKCIGSSHEGVFSVGQDASCGTVSASFMMLLGQYWRDFGLDLFRESKGIEVVRRLVELGVTVDSIDRRCNSHASWNWCAVAEPDTILVSDLATSKSRAYLSHPALKRLATARLQLGLYQSGRSCGAAWTL